MFICKPLFVNVFKLNMFSCKTFYKICLAQKKCEVSIRSETISFQCRIRYTKKAKMNKKYGSTDGIHVSKRGYTMNNVSNRIIYKIIKTNPIEQLYGFIIKWQLFRLQENLL